MDLGDNGNQATITPMIIMVTISKALMFVLAGFLLVVTVGFGVQAPSNQPPDFRAALLNPKDKLWSQRAPDVFRVRMETSKGTFVIEAHRDWAPIGCDRFFNLVRVGFFDNSRFFRVRPGAFTQFGIPGDPVIAAIWRDKQIQDDPVRQSNSRGTIAYAMTGPDTRTTQFYINLSDNSRTDKDGFAPFGEVVEGLEIVDQIYSGYGEEAGGGMRGGKQGKIFEGGNAYLDREFSKLDKLIRATVVRR